MVIFDDRWDMRLASAVPHLFDRTWRDSPLFAVLGVEVDVCRWDRLKHSATRRTNVWFCFSRIPEQATTLTRWQNHDTTLENDACLVAYFFVDRLRTKRQPNAADHQTVVVG